MRVPGLVVAQVDLNEVDPRLDQSAGHQQRPAESMAAVTVEHFRIGATTSKAVLDPGVGQERDGGLSVPVERLASRQGVESGTLVIDAFQ